MACPERRRFALKSPRSFSGFLTLHLFERQCRLFHLLQYRVTRDRKIRVMEEQGLCHPKCPKWEQNKQSDWPDFIGWSKQAIWLVQFLSLWRGFERYFCLRVTKVPSLKSCLWLISFISGWPVWLITSFCWKKNICSVTHTKMQLQFDINRSNIVINLAGYPLCV